MSKCWSSGCLAVTKRSPIPVGGTGPNFSFLLQRPPQTRLRFQTRLWRAGTGAHWTLWFSPLPKVFSYMHCQEGAWQRDRYPLPGTQTQAVSRAPCLQTLSLGGGDIRSPLSSLAQSCYMFPTKAYSLYSHPHNTMAFPQTHLSMVAGVFFLHHYASLLTVEQWIFIAEAFIILKEIRVRKKQLASKR